MSSETFYPDYNHIDQILNKYEFAANDEYGKKSFIYQDPAQIMIRNYISKPTVYDNVLLYHEVGVGKCHKKDTPILMYNGTVKKVQDIKVGEHLMGDDSKPRKVLSLARGSDMMYDVLPIKGEKYTVNEDHILCLKASGFPKYKWSARTNSCNIRWIQDNKFQSKTFSYKSNNQDAQMAAAQQFLKSIHHKQVLEISVKDYLRLSKSKQRCLKGYRTGVDFPSKLIPFDPYTLGYWLGKVQSENEKDR
jgi:hypothetical protein